MHSKCGYTYLCFLLDFVFQFLLFSHRFAPGLLPANLITTVICKHTRKIIRAHTYIA